MNSNLFIGIIGIIGVVIIITAIYLTRKISSSTVPVSGGVKVTQMPTQMPTLKFRIKSLATGYYLGDNGMNAVSANALVFTEIASGNLVLLTSELILKYVEWNGKAMLTNDNQTGGYIATNTSGHTGPSNPFVQISSVQDVLSSNNAREFEVVKEYV